MADTTGLMCKALELAEENVRVFAEAENGCDGSLGREVFARLKQEAEAQLETVTGIHAAVTGGEDFESACVLDEESPAGGGFADMAEKHAEPEVCTTELGALGAAAEVVEPSVAFYQDWLEKAGAGKEKDFADRVLQEQRGWLLMIRDAQYYYEDPEAWYRAGGGLDGA